MQKGAGDFLGVNQERYRGGTTTRQASYQGVKFYDISDRANPRFLSYWETPVSPPDPTTGVYPDARGVHHFNFTGDYLYLGTEYAGYIGKILVILDVSDKRRPRLISRVPYLDPGFDPGNPDIQACRAAANSENSACGNTHAAKSVPGTDLLMVSDEYFTCPYGHVRIVDIADLFMAWYGNGLQVIDISDPRNPVSAGHYNYRIDKELGREEPRYAGSDTYDIIFGPRGHLYLSTARRD